MYIILFKTAIIFFSKLVGHFRFLPSDAQFLEGQMQYFGSMHCLCENVSGCK